MATISVHRSHQLGKEAARAATTRVAEELGRSLRLDYRWEGDDLHFSGSGASGRIRVEETAIHVEVNLGWMLTPFRGPLEQHINTQLDQTLTQNLT